MDPRALIVGHLDDVAEAVLRALPVRPRDVNRVRASVHSALLAFAASGRVLVRSREIARRREAIAHMLADGLSVSEIARRLGVSRKTIYADIAAKRA